MVYLHLLPLLPISAWLIYKFLNYYRIDQLKALPRMKPDLFWGHMKVVGEYVKILEREKKGAHEGMFKLFSVFNCLGIWGT